MAAGDGAQEQARRHAARAEELRRQLERAEAAERSWTAGAEGEREVAALLDSLPEGQVALHDVPWPGRARANLDHVLVGPRSVVVVDSKNWTGEVAVHGGTLWQSGRRRTQSVEGLVRAVAAVAAVLDPAHRTSVRGVLCLVGSGADQPPVEVDGVVITGRDHLLEALRPLQQGRLDPAGIRSVVGQLQAAGSRQLLATPAAGGGTRAPRRPAAPPRRGARAATARRPARRRAAVLSTRDLPGLGFVVVVGGAVLLGGIDGLQSLTQPVMETLFRTPAQP